METIELTAVEKIILKSALKSIAEITQNVDIIIDTGDVYAKVDTNTLFNLADKLGIDIF